MNLVSWIFLAAYLGVVHLIGMRAKKHKRRYWPWAIAAFLGTPLGMVIVFLILESCHHKDLEKLQDEQDVEAGL